MRTLILRSFLLLTSLNLFSCGGGSDPAGHDHVTNTPHVIPPLILADEDVQRWSNPATWGGNLPAEGEAVVIPAGKTVLLDTNINIGSLAVNGNLVCDDKDLNVFSRWIMVHGTLQCGTEQTPYVHNLTITLTANDPTESVMGMGTKTIGAMSGGVISMHGQNRTSWLSLDRTVTAGSTSIETEFATNWRTGDLIVIASTDDDMNHAEVRQLTRVNEKTLRFNEPLRYRHFGEKQTFNGGENSWELDTRAEIGLLSRNIKIQGNLASEDSGFGGHIMIMHGAVGKMAGVELHRMGQSGILARYPFHWHMADNVAGQYFRNSVIRRSYSRCVTVHGSHNARVEDNVCYDHIGHGYFLEDGVETGNVFDHNLGLLTRKPSADIALIPSDIQEGQASRGPSTFWISNGNNTFTNNVAAGSEGLGFWYDTKDAPTGTSASLSKYRNVAPVYSTFGKFDNNRVHSSSMSFSSCTFGSGPIGYSPPNKASYNNLTVYSGGKGAVWPCHGDQQFNRLIVSDTGEAHHAGFVAPRPVTIKNSLFVANSKLSNDGSGRRRSGLGIYDFGVDLRNVHFENFNADFGSSYIFGSREADVRYTNNPSSGLTFKNSPLFYDRRKPVEDMRPSQWGGLIHDEDGSFGLGPNTALVADHPMMTDSTCTDNYGQGKLCANRYGRIELDFGRRSLPVLQHNRSDGRQASATPLADRAHYQSIVSLNHNRYYYGYEFQPEIFAQRSLTVSLDFVHNNDTVVLELTNLPPSANIAGSSFSPVGSFDALQLSTGKSYFRINGSLFIKMKASGEKWYASDRAQINW